MRNDNLKWQPSNITPETITAGEHSLTCLHNMSQTLISGPRQEALELAGLSQCTAWPDIAEGDHYGLSMRRDSILLIGGTPVPQGWLAQQGLAVSDASGQYQVIELKGPQALKLLQQGTELDINQPSAATVRLWHGYGVLLYRHQQQDCFRLHVTRGHFDALWLLLSSLLHDNS